MLADKIRKTALARATAPDRLDTMVSVVSPLGWLSTLTLFLIVAAFLVWSMLTSAPVKVSASGILLNDGEVLPVRTRADGIVAEVTVAVGERVEAQAVLARIANQALADDIERARLSLAGAERDLNAATDDFAAQKSALDEEFARERSQFDARMSHGRALVERQTATLAEQQALHSQGLTTNNNLRAAEAALEQARESIDRARAEMSAREVSRLATLDSARLAMRSHKRVVAEARLRLAELTRRHDSTSLVRAPASGIVAETTAGKGDAVAANQALFKLLPSQAASRREIRLFAVLYVTPEGASRLRPGMDTEVIPSSVHIERDGYIRGRIVSVSALPATRASMMRRLENEILVTSLTKDGPVNEVMVELDRDGTTPSRFAWSTGRGPNFGIETGTTAAGRFVVDRKRLASFVFPRIDEFLPRLHRDQLEAPAGRLSALAPAR